MRHAALGILAGLAMAGCGGAVEAEEPPPATAMETRGGESPAADRFAAQAETAAAPNPWPGRTGTGTKPQSPVSACGPADSYRFVAAEFQCPEGGNPLGGDESAGAGARVGNVGANATGHVIDHYRVECGGGPIDVYVDMYGCPEMQQRLQGMQGRQ